MSHLSLCLRRRSTEFDACCFQTRSIRYRQGGQQAVRSGVVGGFERIDGESFSVVDAFAQDARDVHRRAHSFSTAPSWRADQRDEPNPSCMPRIRPLTLGVQDLLAFCDA